MTAPMRGIFPVLQTPVSEDGELDAAGLRKEVDFCIRAGAHGLVFPVLGSEFQFLTEEERQRLAEVVVDEAHGRVPVVVGVAGASKAAALVHAQHAARIEADAVIALPPYVAAGSREEIREYYEGIARAAARPVFIQHSYAGMDIAFLRDLVREVEYVCYIKEEMQPSAHQISAAVREAGDACLGVFGGAHGRWMLSELRRGASGFMPAAEAVDVHVQIWDAYQAGEEARARDIFNQLLPLINLVNMLGLRVCKEVLVRRGVLAGAAMRMPGATVLDAEDQRELDVILEGVRPLFRV
jgi:4-hydroxy-tetrahydrodipicolinate synthase